MKNQKQRFLKEIAGTETARKWQKETANADRLWRDKKIRTLSWKD